MARYILTGNYSPAAMAGMLAHPSDRAAATGALVGAAGGKLIDFYLTTGEHDFLMVIEAPELLPLISALIVAGGSGAVANLSTAQAFTSAEFLDAQKKAGAIARSYAAPN
jgi:uncharacterized protein with GYD domain